MLLSAVLSALSASVLRVDNDMFILFPDGDPTVDATRRLEAEGWALHLVTVTVDGPPERVSAFLEVVEGRLAGAAEIDFALHGLSPEDSWRLGLLQLGTEELVSLRERLRGAIALGPAAQNPFVAGRLLDLGPLSARIGGASAEASLLQSAGLPRMVIRPVERPMDIQFARKVMDGLQAALQEAREAVPGVEVVFIGGAYRTNVEDFDGILADMRWTGLASFALVFGLLSVAFRDARALVLLGLPLLIGTLWTFGFAGVAVGTLNNFTGFFGAILLGLGVDYTIHLYSRYLEERPRHATVEDAIVAAWDEVGPPCASAALTSAAGFGALCLSGFKGFSGLGLLLSVGLVLCLVSVLVTLPLFIVWREWHPRAEAPARRLRPVERGPGFGVAPVALLLLALATVVPWQGLQRLEFEYDLSALRREGTGHMDLDGTRRTLAQDSFAPLIAVYPTAEALAADERRLRSLQATGELPEVARTLSLNDVLPPDQEDRLGVLRDIQELARSEEAVWLPPTVRSNLERVAGTELAPLDPGDLPHPLRVLLGTENEGHQLLLFPSGNMWDLRETERLLGAVEEHVQAPVASVYLGLGVLARQVREDAPLVVSVALVLVALFLLLDLRRVSHALVAAATFAMGLFWAGGLLGLLGVKVNIMNFSGLPILLGIGVDVVIHLSHRLREEGPGRVGRALATTGWATGLSSLTTVVSFAALSLASSQGVRSLGVLVAVGLSTVTVVSFVMLPLVWMTGWRLKGEDP